jgi:hypothetical protein
MLNQTVGRRLELRADVSATRRHFDSGNTTKIKKLFDPWLLKIPPSASFPN